MHAPRPLGSRVAWVRDFVLVGAASSIAPAVVAAAELREFVVGTAIAGPLTGALLALALRPMLLGPMSRVPFGALIGVGLVLGALWGAMVGGLAGAVAGVLAGRDAMSSAPMIGFGVLYGAAAGAVQLGWFFVPYTIQRARGRWAWPAVVLACVVSPALGWAAPNIVMLLLF